MKKITLILFLAIGVSSIAQAQILKSLKTKAKSAADNSVDRSSDKVVDKAISKPADNITDTALDKVGKKINGLFKKKNRKNKTTDDAEQTTVSDSDSTAIKPVTTDSSAIAPVPDSTAIKPKKQK
jgi:hypothetical protein